MMADTRPLQPKSKGDPFLLRYQRSELEIASEFLTTWLPFLSRDLCPHCTRVLSDRIRSLSTEESSNDREPENYGKNASISTNNHGDCDNHSLGSWKDEADTTSLSSWKEGANGWPDAPILDATLKEARVDSISFESPSPRMSWADMAQEEDELESEEDSGGNKQSGFGHISSGKVDAASKKTELSRDQREYIRFMNVKRKKDFICLERVRGRIVNIVQGLELHTGVFSAAEQKRIVDFIYSVQEKGLKGELKERTFSAPRKWMRGKGRQTIQFGCCYNYASDKNGNPPGILKNADVDPLPPLFNVIIKRLIRWHVLPPACVPDSCIVNIYDEGDCIPPHIDNHDFLRPFCTISFLSECNILFGTDLKMIGPGEFSGAVTISLPVGSVLVLNGNGADVARHCVPAVPTKRISITFRRMDDSKRPFDYAPDPNLEGLEPLCYDIEPLKKPRLRQQVNRQTPIALERDMEELELYCYDAEPSNKPMPHQHVYRHTSTRGFRPGARRNEDPRYSPKSQGSGWGLRSKT